MKGYGILEKEESKSSIYDAVHELRRNGYTKINSGFKKAKIKQIQLKYEYVFNEYHKNYDGLESIDEHNTIRAPLLFDKIFLDLAKNKVVLEILHNLCGTNMILNQQNGITNPPNKEYNQSYWHRDLPYQHYTSSRPLAMNALFCVDDFTFMNGATAVLPGTHLFEKLPAEDFINNNKIQIEAKAGDFIICDAMIYHSGEYNSSKKARRGVNHVYSSPIIRRQIDFSKNDFKYRLNGKNDILGLNFQSYKSVQSYLDSR